MGDVLWNHEVGDNVIARGQPSKNSSSGVGDCYVFKSRLQEYAQKVGIPTPVYDTVKEGPSHEPVFKSTVTVNNVKYESLPGFFNRKVAEQSAAEIALMEIYKSGEKKENIPVLHETGLCKNLLQEYSQKMNYAIPSYKCNKQQEGLNPYICTVEIGGIQYIGAAARTKKEAEIKAARTALIAIQYGSETSTSEYTVLPGKRKPKEQETRPKSHSPTENLKPKKARMKKKWTKRKFPRKNKGETAANPNPNNDEALDHAAAAAEGEDGSNPSTKEENEQASPRVMESNGLGSNASIKDEDGQGSRVMESKEPQQGQTDELKPTVMELNGSCRDDILMTTNAEIFDESREGGATDSAFDQEVKSEAVESIFTVNGEEQIV